MGKVKNSIQNDFGWFFLVKEVSDWTNCSFFEIMDKPAVEILSIVLVMKSKIELNKLNG
jgi:hypothetical protein